MSGPISGLPFLYAVFVALAAALAVITVWSRRRALWKSIAVALVVLVLPLGYFAYVDLLAKPKPMRLEFRDFGETDVISAVMKEGEAIYLWLNVDGEPRYYEMPWSDAVALELQKAMREARRIGTSVGMRLQELVEGEFEGSEEQRPAQKFYALPYPAPPEKRRAIESPKWEI